MSDKAKIRRRLRCPQCGSLDNIKRNNVPNGPGGTLDTETPLSVSERPKIRLADTKTALRCPAVLTENLFDNTANHKCHNHQPFLSIILFFVLR